MIMVLIWCIGIEFNAEERGLVNFQNVVTNKNQESHNWVTWTDWLTDETCYFPPNILFMMKFCNTFFESDLKLDDADQMNVLVPNTLYSGREADFSFY